MSKQDKETIKLLQGSLKSSNETHQLMTNLYLSEQKKNIELSKENDILRSLLIKKK